MDLCGSSYFSADEGSLFFRIHAGLAPAADRSLPFSEMEAKPAAAAAAPAAAAAVAPATNLVDDEGDAAGGGDEKLSKNALKKLQKGKKEKPAKGINVCVLHMSLHAIRRKLWSMERGDLLQGRC